MAVKTKVSAKFWWDTLPNFGGTFCQILVGQQVSQPAAKTESEPAAKQLSKQQQSEPVNQQLRRASSPEADQRVYQLLSK